MDVSIIKQKMAALQQKKEKKTFEKVDYSKFIWKPKEGKAIIRIVPSKFDKKNPFKEIFIHYGIVKYPMLALTNYGEKDPVVEISDRMKKIPNDKESWKMGKKLEPKMRVFVPVVVRGEEELGVRLWEFGNNIYLELGNIISDEDYGDITDIENGRDLVVETVGPAVTGTKFNKSSIRARPKVTLLTDDAKQLTLWLENQPNILEVYPKKTYDEMKDLLEKFLSTPEEGEVSDSKEEAVEETSSVFHTEEPKVKKSKKDAFADLFEDKK